MHFARRFVVGFRAATVLAWCPLAAYAASPMLPGLWELRVTTTVARQAAPAAADNSPAGSSVLGTVRENVQEAGNRIKGQTRTAEGKLVADHGIVKDPKTGQVYTTQGQLTTAIDAADQDASLGFKNIADNLKGYFKGDTKK